MRTTLGAAVEDASRRLGGLTESAVATELRRFVRSRPALLALVFCVGIVAVGVFAGSIAQYDPVTTNLLGRLQPPGEAGHILGTDQLGRDVLARVVHGARVSLLVAVAAATMSITVGMVIGTVAGMRGGMVDVILMRWADGQIGFPFLVVAIVLMAVLGGGLVPVILIIGYWGWVWYGRVVRGIVLSTKQKEFVMAARAVGVSPIRLALRHVLPDTVVAVVVLVTFHLPAVMIIEASLSYLGVGVQPPTPSWGSMLSESRHRVEHAWWLLAAPGVALSLSVLAFNILGERLRERVDPRTRKLV